MVDIRMHTWEREIQSRIIFQGSQICHHPSGMLLNTFVDNLGAEWEIKTEQYSNLLQEKGYWCKCIKFNSGLKNPSDRLVWFDQKHIDAYQKFAEAKQKLL